MTKTTQTQKWRRKHPIRPKINTVMKAYFPNKNTKIFCITLNDYIEAYKRATEISHHSSYPIEESLVRNYTKNAKKITKTQLQLISTLYLPYPSHLTLINPKIPKTVFGIPTVKFKRK